MRLRQLIQSPHDIVESILIIFYSIELPLNTLAGACINVPSRTIIIDIEEIYGYYLRHANENDNDRYDKKNRKRKN